MVDRTTPELAATTPAVSETIQVGGDIIIDEIYLTTAKGEIDIRNFCIQIELYEDIFAPVLQGNILMVDAAGLASKAPITGGEIVTITARTPSFSSNEATAIKRSFVVYSMVERFLEGDSQQFYMLKFISPEGIVDNGTAVSRAFSGTTDAIVAEVFEKYLASYRYVREGKVQTAKTNVVFYNTPNRTSLKMVAPFWSPLKIINWVSSRAQSSRGNANNFLFFETNKQFYFGSVEEIIQIQLEKKNLFAEYSFSDVAVRDPGASAFNYVAPNIGREYNTISAMRMPRMFDMMRAQDFGYYSSTLIFHDILLKRYRELSWDYLANFNSYKHAEKNPPFASTVHRAPETHRSFRTKHYMMHETHPDNKVEQWAPQRNSLLYSLSDVRMEIDVAGRTDVEAGRLIYVHFPTATDKSQTSKDNFDPYLSGVYIITAIRHVISLNGKHYMSMEIVKESMKESLG